MELPISHNGNQGALDNCVNQGLSRMRQKRRVISINVSGPLPAFGSCFVAPCTLLLCFLFLAQLECIWNARFCFFHLIMLSSGAKKRNRTPQGPITHSFSKIVLSFNLAARGRVGRQLARATTSALQRRSGPRRRALSGRDAPELPRSTWERRCARRIFPMGISSPHSKDFSIAPVQSAASQTESSSSLIRATRTEPC
jgi:hypothetical protein